jgi:hypothetical protein
VAPDYPYPVHKTAARVLLVLSLALVPACGGSSDSVPRKFATATPPPEVQGPKGVDVAAVNKARDDFVAACDEREKSGGSLTNARQAAATLLDALEANPDERFKRSPGTPAASMRDRVRALALIARTRCGGSDAKKLGNRLARAVKRTS